jgi:hypothetical protein
VIPIAVVSLIEAGTASSSPCQRAPKSAHDHTITRSHDHAGIRVHSSRESAFIMPLETPFLALRYELTVIKPGYIPMPGLDPIQPVSTPADLGQIGTRAHFLLSNVPKGAFRCPMTLAARS